MGKSKVRKCKFCGCTEARACQDGCSWIADDVDICSSCYLTPLETQELLASVKVYVTQKLALSWTLEQRLAAGKWAVAVKWNAAGEGGATNDRVKVPKIPSHVRALQKKALPAR